MIIRHTHEHNTSITEKRAPTDESVRLLREMEQAAEEKILKRVNLQNTDFPFDVVISSDPTMDTLKMTAVFAPNGKEFRVTHEGMVPYRTEGAKQFAADFFEEISKELTRRLLRPHEERIIQSLRLR